MNPLRLGIVGGGLQGTETAYLARELGFRTVLIDERPEAPASQLAHLFLAQKISSLSDCDSVFRSCDLVLPACEDLHTLRLLDAWAEKSGIPLAFHLPSYLVSQNKLHSKNLFNIAKVPTPEDWPTARFPLIAKPSSLSGSRGVCHLNNQEELSRAFPQKGDMDGWVLEEYCPGPSYSIEIVGRDGNYETFQITNLEMDEVYDCCGVWSPTDLSAPECLEFQDIAQRLAQELALVGLMDVEIIKAPQGLKVLEIDARMPSQTPTVVWKSTGINILEKLARCFLNYPDDSKLVEKKENIFVVYEHIKVENGKVTIAGEHIMSKAGPLVHRYDFAGANEALTNWQEGRKCWVATMIYYDQSIDDLQLRRQTLCDQIKKMG